MSFAIRLSAALGCLLVALVSTPAEARRVALVIGNSAYAVGRLANPENDATAVAQALEKQLKFDKVLLERNLNFIEFRNALSRFASEAAGADVAVVYFAGHGMELAGTNYLIPVDAALRRSSDLDLQAIPLQTVLNQLDSVRTLALVVLDACRDNPFPLPGAKRTVQRGLKAIEPAENMLVLYAAKDGTTAADGAGRRHSPFTESVLKHIGMPLEVRYLVAHIRDDVMKATGNAQVPHTYGTLGAKKVYLVRPPEPVVTRPELPPPPPSAGKAQEVPVGPKGTAVVTKDADVASRDKDIAAASTGTKDARGEKKDAAPSQPPGRPFDRVVADIRPAVVEIEVQRSASSKLDTAQPAPSGTEQAKSTGVLVSADGYVVTALSVIGDARDLQVRVDGKGVHKADVVGRDDRTNIALLKLRQPGTWSFVALSSGSAKLGEPVLAIGSAFGLRGTVLKGHVTGLDRTVGNYYGVIQTDIGFPKDDFMGSPLFDMQGHVAGIVAVKGTSDMPLVLALPTTDVVHVVEQLKAHGTVKRGWLGVRIQDIDGNMAASLGLRESKGALVAEVTSPGPAATAGIQRGDVILSINDKKVAGARDLARLTAGIPPDTTVELKVVRSGKEQTMPVRLGLLPAVNQLTKSSPPVAPRVIDLNQLGVLVGPVQGPSREGVQVTGVRPESPASGKLLVGDIILEADNRTVNTAEDLDAAVRDASGQGRRAILLLIMANNERRFTAIPLRPD